MHCLLILQPNIGPGYQDTEREREENNDGDQYPSIQATEKACTQYKEIFIGEAKEKRKSEENMKKGEARNNGYKEIRRNIQTGEAGNKGDKEIRGNIQTGEAGNRVDKVNQKER